MAEFVAYVKAHAIKDGVKEGHKGQLGACPFSHRVLLLLEEKEIPYELEFVNLSDKPKWLLDVTPDGTVPVLKDCKTGDYIVDSDVISDYLEQKYGPASPITRRPLGQVVDCPQPGSGLWPNLKEFLAKGSGQEALLEELKQVEQAVGDSKPYVMGKDPCAWDVALAPRLYLARVGCKALHDWDFTEDLPNVKSYLHRWTGRSSWRNTASWDEESIVEDLKQLG